ncbi:MAG TPA: hypothetical protein VFV49_07555 [Thermoanaerobaculia bacterium]|nr:hypothetical protein [Thermoanaerobaculia bacterium]
MSVALLLILLVLFVARVAGQIAVVLIQPRWLPPMKDWYSGLMPYRYLLPAQIAIIALMVAMIRQVASGAAPNRSLAIGIFAFATVYAISMLVRFVILRRRHPEYRWYEGGMIPILFHWVLAAFLFTYAAARF